jgi:hypothetical protein
MRRKGDEYANCGFTDKFRILLKRSNRDDTSKSPSNRSCCTDSLQNAPEAFIGMLEGHNFGKLIVRVDP